ncbi:YcdB/YcdC domain-containing protein [Lysinibacillus sp. NPDC056232]|uniref:YcdB/YcdC domain-containing protein n=1 Tax=Lysinibacillus sp. NPDC056232 TaxID=3345756 RepID=UPI0035E0324B
MQKDKLKLRALSIVPLPSHFKLIIEEYSEDERVMFSWANEQQDESMTVELDCTGNLIYLSIETNDTVSEAVSLSIEEKRRSAEQFLLSHYPSALEDLTFSNAKELSRVDRFYFEQIVMDLPLEHAGCFIDVDALGNIVGFRYDGVKTSPEIPSRLVSKKALMEHVRNELALQLVITRLSRDVYNMKKDGLHLVYQVNSFLHFKADSLEPKLTSIHDENEPESYATLPPLPTNLIADEFTNEAIIGITDELELIREVDRGPEIGIVWRIRDWEMREKDLSLNSFFKMQSEDTVKAIISKKTGKVQSFIWMYERSGNLQLSQAACYQKALDFLLKIIPDYYPYIQRLIREDEEEDNTSQRESFIFQAYNSQGILIHDMVGVVVNRMTGQIDNYAGPNFDVIELSQVPTGPRISMEEAYRRFLENVDFQLIWDKNYDDEIESYQLIYQACDRHTRSPIRYIDATTGEIIVSNV